MAVFVAVLATLTFVAQQLFSIREYHRRGPASEKLIKPLIAYHEMMHADEEQRARGDRALMASLIGEAVQQFRAAMRSSWRNIMESETSRPGLPFGWPYTWALLHESLSDLRFSQDRLRDVLWHKRMEAYHEHMIIYYQELLQAHTIALPTLPAHIMAERRLAEAELRRMHGKGAMLQPEPPPHLLPGYQPPKSSPAYRGPAMSDETSW
jgi:hypothetical protein